MKMVGHGIVVDLAEAAFLGANGTGKITQLVDCQWQVCGHRFTNRFTVVPGLGHRQHEQVLLHAIGHTNQ